MSQVEVLAIVPARGGSKSIPRKNVRLFGGHPLLAYSIAAGLQAESVNRVIVSTDDSEFARQAEIYGAEVPFLRPQALAADETPDLPVFVHVLQTLKETEGYRPDLVVQLRPTSPIRPPDCIDRAVEMLIRNNEADSVRGVVVPSQNPYKMWEMDADGKLRPLIQSEIAEPFNAPRQILPVAYWQTGHVDVIRVETIEEKKSMTGDVILGLTLDPAYTVDIDSERDWRDAERTLLSIDQPLVQPGKAPRSLPQQVGLLVLDFDGTLTDDRVWVDAEGNETVAAHRGDGWGIVRLRERGIPIHILSTETHPVVEARARKLGVPVTQGAKDKGPILEELIQGEGISREQVVYVGNDVNDLSCFPLVGFAAAVADAHPEVKREADLVLTKPGGRGAVRELCDKIMARLEQQ
ncbi:MAG: cytidylyltransferase domain-containing protein [Anaerolineales bacterium]